MAAFDSSPWIGARTVRPTEAQLQTLLDYARGMGDVPVANFWRHAGYFTISLSRFTAVSNTTAFSVAYTAKIPFKVVAMQVGCESAAATSATGDVQKNPAGDPDTWATMSTGAVDIKTGAGDAQDLPVLDGSEDFAAGDEIRLAILSGSAADVIGGQALLHCFRL